MKMSVLSSRICAVHIIKLSYYYIVYEVSLDSSALETTLGSLGLKRFQGVANGGVVMEGSCV